jgi:hypothetical protein
MHYLSILTLALTSAYQASALGINCRGSSSCFGGLSAMGYIADAMDQAIADGHGGDWFGTGSKLSLALCFSVILTLF